MAGPVLSVLIETPFEPTWREAIGSHAGDWSDAEGCGVPASGDGTNEGSVRPFVGSVDTADDRASVSDAEVAAIRECSGREWTHAIVVAAMCNQPVDHRTLAELVASIAEERDGIVDLGRLDLPDDIGDTVQCTWSEDATDQWTLLAHPAAVRGWMSRPQFRLLK